jgi:hypothetical protein
VDIRLRQKNDDAGKCIPKIDITVTGIKYNIKDKKN